MSETSNETESNEDIVLAAIHGVLEGYSDQEVSPSIRNNLAWGIHDRLREIGQVQP